MKFVLETVVARVYALTVLTFKFLQSCKSETPLCCSSVLIEEDDGGSV